MAKEKYCQPLSPHFLQHSARFSSTPWFRFVARTGKEKNKSLRSKSLIPACRQFDKPEECSVTGFFLRAMAFVKSENKAFDGILENFL